MVVFIFIKSVLEMFLFVLALAAILFVGGRWFLQDYYNEVAAQLVRVGNEKMGVNQRIRTANAVVAQTKELQKNYVLWTPILTALSEATPEGIILDSMLLDQQAKTYTFSGTAATRDALLAFERELRELPIVAKVDLPLSQLTEREQIPFIITALIK